MIGLLSLAKTVRLDASGKLLCPIEGPDMLEGFIPIFQPLSGQFNHA